MNVDVVVRDCERFIHKTASILKGRNDILVTYDELVGEGYLVLARFLHRHGHKDEFHYRYFGRSLWSHVLAVVKRHSGNKPILIDISKAYSIGSMEASDEVYAYFKLQHAIAMLGEFEREVVTCYIDPLSEDMKEHACERGLRQESSIAFLMSWFNVSQRQIYKVLDAFNETLRKEEIIYA